LRAGIDPFHSIPSGSADVLPLRLDGLVDAASIPVKHNFLQSTWMLRRMVRRWL
jgi:hypothetical protein